MLRKICVGVAALLLAGSLARGGEELGIKVEGGLDIGSLSADILQDAGESFDVSVVMFQPYLQVSKFEEGVSFSGRLRFLVTTEDETDWLGADWDCSMDSFEFQGLFGWGFKVNEDWMVTPLLGFSYRTTDMEADGPITIDYEFDSVTIDFGVRAQGKLNDQLDFVGLFTISPIITGDAEVGDPFDIDDDIDSGLVFELRLGVDWKINEQWAVQAAFVYENLSQETGDDIDAEDDVSKVGVQLGATFKF